MRVESGLTIDELAERLAISRQTIYYWVRDLPIEREPGWNSHGGAAAMKTKYQILREAAYTEGLAEFGELARERSFRDFRARLQAWIDRIEAEWIDLAAGA